MGDAIRVYLLDDHEVVREGLRFLLERTEDIEVVGSVPPGGPFKCRFATRHFPMQLWPAKTRGD